MFISKHTYKQSTKQFKGLLSSKILESRLRSRFLEVNVSSWGRPNDLGFRFRTFDFLLDRGYRVNVAESLFFSCENRCTEQVLNIHQNISISCDNTNRKCSKRIEILVSFNEKRERLTVTSASKRQMEALLDIWKTYILPRHD